MSVDVAKKECLQSDIDSLSATVARLETKVAEFALPSTTQGKSSEVPTISQSVPESLRHQIQTIDKRLVDVSAALACEFGKLT